MLKEQFKRAVEWCLSPGERMASGRRLAERLFANWTEAAEKRDGARLRQQLIHDQAARAVEWNWDKPLSEMREFIERETPPGGYLWGVTPQEIYDYGQQHRLELLPKRVDEGSCQELETLRRTLEGRAAPAPSPR